MTDRYYYMSRNVAPQGKLRRLFPRFCTFRAGKAFGAPFALVAAGRVGRVGGSTPPLATASGSENTNQDTGSARHEHVIDSSRR